MKGKSSVNHISVRAEGVGGGMNIKDFLKNRLGLSATLVKRVKFGGVFINARNVHMRATVNEGDTVEVYLPEDKSDGIEPVDIPLDVIFEDEFILAVRKPVNMPTHPSRGNSLPTLANAVMAYMGENFVFRSVNRLDKNTSGIVLIAKDALTAALLGKMMKNRKFSKKYEAVLIGTPTPTEGIIDAPIERENTDGIKRCVRCDGKEALTSYRVIRTLEGGNSLVEFTLHTGRTHQIRVHSAYIGHPLLGDEMYGGGEGIYRLHCKELSFLHPKTGEALVLRCGANFDI